MIVWNVELLACVSSYMAFLPLLFRPHSGFSMLVGIPKSIRIQRSMMIKLQTQFEPSLTYLHLPLQSQVSFSWFVCFLQSPLARCFLSPLIPLAINLARRRSGNPSPPLPVMGSLLLSPNSHSLKMLHYCATTQLQSSSYPVAVGFSNCDIALRHCVLGVHTHRGLSSITQYSGRAPPPSKKQRLDMLKSPFSH